MFGYFYHGTIRKFVVAFGTLFNNIYISRTDENGEKTKHRVPLSYSEKDKYIRRIQEFPYVTIDENNPDIAFSYMPRMSFEMNNLTYDPSRKRSTLSRVYQPTADGTSYTFTYAEVPYNLDFHVHIMARKMEDGLQIIEQIMPYFAPEFVISLDLGTFARKIDIPIVLNSYEHQIEYESEADDGTEHRIIIWTLNFTMRGYLYGPTKNAEIIKRAISQFFDYRTLGVSGGVTGASADRLETVVVSATGGTGTIVGATGYGYIVEVFGADATDEDIFG